MRAILVVTILALISSGCESMQRLTNRSGLTSAEQAKLDQQEQARLVARAKAVEARREFLAHLVPNLTFEQVRAAAGSEARTDLIDGQFHRYYDDEFEPMILVFDKNSKLVGWRLDDREIARRERAREAELDRDQAERTRQSMVIQGAINSMPQTQNCTSYPTPGGGFSTTCR